MRNLFATWMLLLVVVVLHPVAAFAQDQEEIKTKTKVAEKTIPYEVKYVFNRDLRPGVVKKVTDGVNGKITWTLKQYIQDGKVVKEERQEDIVEPKPAVFHMGRSGFSTSRGSFTRGKVVTMESTAYLPTDGSGHGITASGRRAEYGVVAVDPRVIPLGSLVFVEGYGLAIAADTGGAIKGNKIDVCMHDRREAMQWGRRKVKVHIFRKPHQKSEEE